MLRWNWESMILSPSEALMKAKVMAGSVPEAAPVRACCQLISRCQRETSTPLIGKLVILRYLGGIHEFTRIDANLIESIIRIRNYELL
jgi:hypothetical protein